MTLHVALDFRFVRLGGEIHTEIAFSYDYWREYLEVFERVRPIARVYEVSALTPVCRRADGERVEFVPVTNYLGLWSWAKRAHRVVGDCWKAVSGSEMLVLRWGLVGALCGIFARVQRKPHGFEFVGNAKEGVRPVRNIQIFGLNHLLAAFTQFLGRWSARGACCNSYVSRSTQALYPGRHPAREWVFSSVELGRGVLGAPRDEAAFRTTCPHIISVARLEPEKGNGVLIAALAQLRRAGLEFKATLVGPGRDRERLEQQVQELGLADVVKFTGLVAWGPQLWALLDDADLFVMPSLTEGMSRALIESMARGVPCIGTSAGGNAEMLAPTEQVPPGDAQQMAELMRAVLASPRLLAEVSHRGFERAREYHPDEMRRRKHAFWNCLKAEALRRGSRER